MKYSSSINYQNCEELLNKNTKKNTKNTKINGISKPKITHVKLCKEYNKSSRQLHTINKGNLFENYISYSFIPKVNYFIKYTQYINDLDLYLMYYHLFSIMENNRNIHNIIIKYFPNIITKNIIINIGKPFNLEININLNDIDNILIYRIYNHNETYKNSSYLDIVNSNSNLDLYDDIEKQISRITNTNKSEQHNFSIDILTCIQMIKKTIYTLNKSNIINKCLILKMFEFTKSLDTINKTSTFNLHLSEVSFLYKQVYEILSIIPYQK